MVFKAAIGILKDGGKLAVTHVLGEWPTIEQNLSFMAGMSIANGF
ncbi:MAG TPA: hypothetical protein VE866_12750 [Candidatus Binatia bacterium]|nr:hypothetical protein [Candidatus Binatia bacterium]